MSVFAEYAWVYDQIYRDKPYQKEATYISTLINSLYPQKQRAETRLLDLACGTGRHAIEWAKMGYVVEGSDLSSEMIQAARHNSAREMLDIKWHNQSFQSCSAITQKFDVVVSMFSAIDYLEKSEDFALAMRNIHGLLNPGGYFIFDFWNGNAVLKDYSPVRVRRMQDGSREVIRISNTTLDPMAQVAEVRFDLLVLENDRLLKEFKEVHRMRYFFPQEMKDLLQAHGFESVKQLPFMETERSPGPTDWNLTFIMRKG